MKDRPSPPRYREVGEPWPKRARKYRSCGKIGPNGPRKERLRSRNNLRAHRRTHATLHSQTFCKSLDGEIVFADGVAVNWRELWMSRQAADRGSVLAKTMEGVRLLDIASLAGVGQLA